MDLLPAPGLVANFDFSVAPPRETIAGQPIAAQGGALSQTLAPAVFFDGQMAGLMISGQQPLPVLNAFTASAWIAFSGAQGTQAILTSGDPGASPDCFVLGLKSPGMPSVSLFAEINGEGVTQPISINVGDWHNVAVTFDGQICTLYLDGQMVYQSVPFSPPANYSSSPFWTAGFAVIQQAKTAWFGGYIQWASLWSRCLTPNEVVYQQYASASTDDAIQLDASLDGTPTDLASLLSLELGGTADLAVQRVTVTTWSPPPDQLNPPSGGADTMHARTLDSVTWPTPVGGPAEPMMIREPEAVLAAAEPELEQNLARLDEGVAQTLRERFRQRTVAALGAPTPLPGSWRREGDEQVFVFTHPTDGAQELLRVRADGITDCQMWWLNFSVTLPSGFLNLVFISIRGQDLIEWVQRRLLSNQTVMEGLAAAWRESPDFTGFTVIKLLAVIYKAGLFRNFLWFVAYRAGYYALFRLVTWAAALVLTGGATAVLFAGTAAVLAVQLGLQVTGAPNIPSYGASCQSMAGVRGAKR